MWITSRLALQICQLDPRVDPFFDEFTKAFVVAQLLFDRGKIVAAHKLGAAPAAPCVAELVIGAMLLGRIAFAAAGWISADVVLLREAAGS